MHYSYISISQIRKKPEQKLDSDSIFFIIIDKFATFDCILYHENERKIYEIIILISFLNSTTNIKYVNPFMHSKMRNEKKKKQILRHYYARFDLLRIKNKNLQKIKETSRREKFVNF